MQAADRILLAFKGLIYKGMPIDGSELDPIPEMEESTILELCEAAKSRLMQGSALVHKQYRNVIIGDLHGNIRDLIRILHLFKTPKFTSYIFLGDYVDRGDNSIDVITLLLAFYVKYPENVTLLRGNHEFIHMNHVYGFYEEVMARYGNPNVWAAVNEVFTYLPLVAILGNKLFCVHGGLSPHMQTLSDLDSIKLPIRDYEGQPMISDLVWSDPEVRLKGYGENDRGSGVTFGSDVVRAFLSKNQLQLMIRAHQINQNGVHAFAEFLGVTVFSCSNYCASEENKAGVICVKDNGEFYFYSLGAPATASIRPRVVMELAPPGEMGLRKFTKRKDLPAKAGFPLVKNKSENDGITDLMNQVPKSAHVKSARRHSLITEETGDILP